MVKIGFICEGETERLIIESASFNTFLKKLNLILIRAIDAEGNGNLLPKNIEKFIAILEDMEVEKIFILTDLDTDTCITFTKQRIAARTGDIIIIAVKAIEAWFLADNSTLSALFKTKFECNNPENEDNPYTTLNNLFLNCFHNIHNAQILLFSLTLDNLDLFIGQAVKLINQFINFAFKFHQETRHSRLPRNTSLRARVL